MNFLTHSLISKTLCRHLSKKMDLDLKAFSYGNIKPDLSPQCLRNPHMLENYLFIIQHDYNRLISHNAPVKEFSIALGVFCHYICAFFCRCHLNHKLYHKLLSHFIYEIRLHMAFCSMLRHEIKLEPDRKGPAGNLAATVMVMRKEYMTKQKTLQMDIEYAVMTSFFVCQLIDRSIKNAAEKTAAASGTDYFTASYSPYRG